MRGQAPISSVYRQAQYDAPEPDWEQWSRIERLRRKAWKERGVVSVIVSELPDPLRDEIKSWAEENYGPR